MSPQTAINHRVGLFLMIVGVVAGLLVVMNAIAVTTGLWRVPTDMLLIGVALGLVAYPTGYAIREGVSSTSIGGGELLDVNMDDLLRRSDR